jgi:hypothetical protein
MVSIQPRNKLPWSGFGFRDSLCLPKARFAHHGERIRMPYILQAEDPRGDAFSISVADPKQALATALEWESEGRSGVKIIGDGRIYTTKELARAIIDKE